MTDDELSQRILSILHREYPFLFDRRVKKFIQFLQNNYEVKKDTSKDSTNEQ